MSGIVLGIVAAKDEKEAGRIAGRLLEKRLAACCNIIPAIKSSYWWKGRIESSSEAMLIIKTKKQLADDVIAEVKAAHSYEVPAIDFINVIKANKDCVRWMKEVTKNAG